MYFKILNHHKIIFESASDDVKESYLEYEEYNYQLDKQYFDKAWFYSEATPREKIEYQVFFTNNTQYQTASFFRDPQAIQEYYASKNNIPFFRELAEGTFKEQYSIFKLEKVLTYEDFRRHIYPNLQVNLIQEIYITSLWEPSHYLFFHWDFFEELQIGEYSNSLVRHLDHVPYGTTSRYESYQQSALAGLNVVFENAHSTVDTRLKGLNTGVLLDEALFILEKTQYWGILNFPKARRIEDLPGIESRVFDGESIQRIFGKNPPFRIYKV